MFWHLYAEEQTVGRCPMVLSMSSQEDLRPRYPMSRRAFVSMVTAGGASTLIQGTAAARAPDAGEDYTALAKTFPTPPATARIVFDGDEGRLSEAAFLRDFAGDLPEAKAKVSLCGPGAVPQGSALGQDDACGLAVEAEFLCRFDRRPDHQSRSRTFHGQAHGRAPRPSK